jgi:hypothetical protein
MQTKERFIMNKRILVAAMTVASLQLVGCSSTQTSGINPGSNATTGISDQRLATSDFKRQGVRITYTLSGEIESIEVTGYAAVWGASQNAAREAFRVAELEAKKSLNDFINKESIQSSVSVRMISQNLEHAKDQKTNNFASNKSTQSDELVAVDAEPAPSTTADNVDKNAEENIAIRNDALKIASRVSTTIVTQNKGILSGLYLVQGNVINDGKNVEAVYRWDRKSNATRVQLRNLMAL